MGHSNSDPDLTVFFMDFDHFEIGAKLGHFCCCASSSSLNRRALKLTRMGMGTLNSLLQRTLRKSSSNRTSLCLVSTRSDFHHQYFTTATFRLYFSTSYPNGTNLRSRSTTGKFKNCDKRVACVFSSSILHYTPFAIRLSGITAKANYSPTNPAL